MKRVWLPLIMLCAMASSAVASKLLVLHSEGRADARTRARVDAAIVKVAKAGPDAITPGEITFSEAAAMIGCRAEDPACAGDVASALGVDEVVIVTVTPKPPDGYEVKVRRAGKQTSKDAAATIAADKLDRLDALAPMFGGKAAPPPPPPPPTFEPPGGGPVKPVGPEPPPPNGVTTTTEPVKPETPITDPKPTDPVPDTTPLSVNEPAKTPAAPLQTDKRKFRRDQLYLAGMITGAGMTLFGVVLWGAAASVQGQINDAPTRTRADLQHLQNLEDKADGLAGAGNFFTITGLLIGGASTYFYIKHRRAKQRASKTAFRIYPTVLPGGGGVTLSLGGTP